LKNKFVLVTGGAGYVGSNICKILNDKGFTPVVFDNLSTGHKQFVKWGPLVEGDILNTVDLETAFQKFSITSVIHCAAKAYVNESISDPIKYYRENINGSVNLLDTFIKHKGINFIFSSSCSVYGNSTSTRIQENHKTLPINPYGFTKLAIENLIKDLRLIHKFNYAILRYFNAAGADLESEIGEKHDPETHVIPLLVNSSKNQTVFKIYGKNYFTLDGTAVRDFTHVTDLAIAHARALEYISDLKKDIICNLGTGVETSILDLVLQMQKIDPNFKFIFEKYRDGDPGHLVADNEVSRNILKLEYANSSVSNILNTALQWSKY
jgi:UDP-glucose-4-epimerase GalE